MKRLAKNTVLAGLIFSLVLVVASSAFAKGPSGKSGSCSHSCYEHCCYNNYCCHNYCYNYCTPCCYDYCYPTTCYEPVVVEQPVCQPVCQPVVEPVCYSSNYSCYPYCNYWKGDCHKDFCMHKGMKK